MTETLPAWLWIPLAIVLYGYFAADAIARRLRHPARHQERKGGPEHQSGSQNVHATESSSR